MYLSDCSSYSSRNSVFRDYEKFPYGSLERNANPQKSYYTIVQGMQFIQLIQSNSKVKFAKLQ